jgi:hypothetical protein
MSQVAENFTPQDETALECVAALPVPEVVEHFGEVQAVLKRLAVRDAAAKLLADCVEALDTPFYGDFGLLARLRLHSSSLGAALASSGPRGLDLAFKAAESSLARFNRSLAASRAAGL